MNIQKTVTAGLLAATLLLGATGCSLTSQAENEMVAIASDGSLANIGNVKLRNMIYLSTGTGVGKLIGTAVNAGDKDVQLQIQWVDFDMFAKTNPVLIPAGEAVSWGANPEVPALELNIWGSPGSNTTIWVSVDGATGLPVTVPILDGTLEQYAPYFKN
jgi:hypothetical protein